MADDVDQGAEATPKRGRLSRLLLTVALVAVAAYVGACVWFGFRRTVHVINGLPVTYEVVVNGRPVTLGANAHIALTMPEGDVAFAVSEPALHIADGVCSVTTSFWARPFTRTVFVLNPDRAALLALIKMTFTSGDAPVPPGQDVTLFAGEPNYRFDGVDYPFADMPSQVRASGSAPITRTSLQFVPGFDPATTAKAVGERCGAEAARTVLSALANAQPDDIATLAAVSEVLPTEDIIAFFATRLDDKPVLVNWHRRYQAAMHDAGRSAELVEEYRRRVEADPSDGALLYLLARATPDPREKAERLQLAARTDPPCAYAFHAMAYQALGDARYEDALADSRRALELRPGDPLFQMCEAAAMLALDQYETLLERTRKVERPVLQRATQIRAEMYLRLRLGEKVAAAEAMADYLTKLKQVADGVAVDEVEAQLSATLAYLTDGREAFAKWIAKTGPAGAFKAHLALGELDAALEALDAEGPVDALHALLLYIAAEKAGREDIATPALAKAVAAMRAGRYDLRFFADRLAAETPPDAARVLIEPMLPNDKRVIMAAFGMRFPKDRAAYFALARKLNTHRLWPYRMLNDVLTDSEKKDTP